MCEVEAKGFCDLNISANDNDLKPVVLKALSLGYQTIAINREISEPESSSNEKKKKKKGDSGLQVPSPPTLKLTEDELKKHKIKRPPVILTRLTVAYADKGSAFLHKLRDSGALTKYDIIAFRPRSEGAFRQVCQANMDVDIISFDIGDRDFRISRKMLNLAIERDLYFEICYAPCIARSSSRQDTIVLAHDIYQSARGRNIFISSGTKVTTHLRQPYDVANLGRLFGLSEGAAKEAVLTTCHDLVYAAWCRRVGLNKCSAVVVNLENSRGQTTKFKGLDDPRNCLKRKRSVNDEGDPGESNGFMIVD
ncbi:ribonuclease P protein subunit Rpp30 [Oratosquilla oratoria]|uniref:ribonuclease P protein subunit Rpp30 n=1 Tax=Oratosquilla oratoria TaxID=337810 RepID=UPI003F75C939